jgi:hypothetical protein
MFAQLSGATVLRVKNSITTEEVLQRRPGLRESVEAATGERQFKT